MLDVCSCAQQQDGCCAALAIFHFLARATEGLVVRFLALRVLLYYTMHAPGEVCLDLGTAALSLLSRHARMQWMIGACRCGKWCSGRAISECAQAGVACAPTPPLLLPSLG